MGRTSADKMQADDEDAISRYAQSSNPPKSRPWRAVGCGRRRWALEAKGGWWVVERRRWRTAEVKGGG